MTHDGSDRRVAGADALAEDFGPRSATARRAVAAFYRALVGAHDSGTHPAIARWREQSADFGRP
ncbi:MAG: hypothetical protein NTW96_15835 [Planctomycetia bacterium]|nr:hypothetical protein [Planctomycetia bacterium]